MRERDDDLCYCKPGFTGHVHAAKVDADNKPEFLVRVDYEIPPTRGIASMYFEDIETLSDEDYETALHKVYRTAIIRGIKRKLKPGELTPSKREF